MLSFNEMLDFALIALIGAGLCVAVVVPASIVMRLTQKKPPAELEIVAPKLVVPGDDKNWRNYADRLDKPFKDDDGTDGQTDSRFSAAEARVTIELQSVKQALTELKTSVHRMKDTMPAYIAKNLAWAIIGSILGLVGQELLIAVKPAERPQQPNFVEFGDQ